MALAGCGERGAARGEAVAADPAAAIALAAPLLTDPDLATQSRRFAALSDPGPLDASLPPAELSPTQSQHIPSRKNLTPPE